MSYELGPLLLVLHLIGCRKI